MHLFPEVSPDAPYDDQVVGLYLQKQAGSTGINGESLSFDCIDPQLVLSPGSDFFFLQDLQDHQGKPVGLNGTDDGCLFQPQDFNAPTDPLMPEYSGFEAPFDVDMSEASPCSAYHDQLQLEVPTFERDIADQVDCQWIPTPLQHETYIGGSGSTTKSKDADVTTLMEAPEEAPKGRKRGRKPRSRTDAEKKRQLQKQRQRNRLAAGKCRAKKKGETDELIQKAEILQKRRTALQTSVDVLSSEVLDLKEAVMKHRFCLSGEIDVYLQHQFKELMGDKSATEQTESAVTSPSLADSELVFSPLTDSPFSGTSP